MNIKTTIAVTALAMITASVTKADITVPLPIDTLYPAFIGEYSKIEGIELVSQTPPQGGRAFIQLRDSEKNGKCDVFILMTADGSSTTTRLDFKIDGVAVNERLRQEWEAKWLNNFNAEWNKELAKP
jgi:hypothetical protein